MIDQKESDAINAFKKQTWDFWTPDESECPPCVRCMAPAVCLHEITPKSLDRSWFDKGPEDSIPVCDPCHKWAATAGDAGQIELRAKATIRLQMVGDWKKSRVIRDEIYSTS